jgi:molecular chaperone HscB
MEACPSCGARPRTSLLCEACGELLEPRSPPSPFEALGLEPAFALDLGAARARLLALSRALHPDFHGTADAGTRRLAEDNTAALNAAFQVLSDDLRRADWFVRALGGPGEAEERSMPGAFLQEVLEWNETIEEARQAAPGSPARAALRDLAAELDSARAAGIRRVAGLLTPPPPHGDAALRKVRQELNALRYMERALREIGELQLAARP